MRQAALQRRERRRLAEAQRDHEREWLRLAAERRVERLSGLAQRQVKRGAVKGPAAIQPRDIALGRHREQVELVDQLAELAQA